MNYEKILSDEFENKNYYYFKNLKVMKTEESKLIIEFDYQRRVSKKFKEYSSDLIIKIACNEGHCRIETVNSTEAINELITQLKDFVWATTGW